MMISICSILKLSGAHSILPHMIKAFVFMHIIGKILDENHRFITMIQLPVKIGNQLTIY